MILSSLSGVSSSLSPSLLFVCPVEGRLFSCGEEENRRWKMSYWLQSRGAWVSVWRKERQDEWVQWHIINNNNNLTSDAPYCSNPCLHNEILLIVPFSTNVNIKSILWLVLPTAWLKILAEYVWDSWIYRSFGSHLCQIKDHLRRWEDTADASISDFNRLCIFFFFWKTITTLSFFQIIWN